jgi:hypothetical protein
MDNCRVYTVSFLVVKVINSVSGPLSLEFLELFVAFHSLL